MPQNVLDPKIGGGAEGMERPLQMLVGWINGYTNDDPPNGVQASPIYNGPGALFDGLRSTVAGSTLRLRSLAVNHLTLATGGASSDLSWSLGPLTASGLTVNGPTSLVGTLAVTGATSLAGLTAQSLAVNGASTLTGTLHTTGAATFDGPVTLGDNAADSIVFNGTPTFNTGLGPISVTDLTVTGNTALGNANTDTVTVIGVSTFRNAASSATQLLVDAGNNRVVVGSGTALGTDTVPALHVVGRLYVAPESSNDFALQVRRSNSFTVGFNLGITSTNDFIFKDDGGGEVFRVGDVASTYQALVTGKFGVTGNTDFASSVTVAGNITLNGATLALGTANTTTDGDLTGTAGTFDWKNGGNSRLKIDSTGVGFFGAATGPRPTVVGVRTGTLAQLQTVVANLLTALAGASGLGLITDSTT